MSLQPLIVWDFDDVLFPLMEGWFTAFGKNLRQKVASYEEITDNPPHQLMDISLQTYLESLDTYRNSEQAQALKPKQDILDWFTLNGNYFRHFVLTARPLHTLNAVGSWLDINFANYFEGLDIVPAPRQGHNLHTYHRSKREYIESKQLPVDYFIDDNDANIVDVGKLSKIQSILYPQPWNKLWREKKSLNQILNLVK